MTDWFTVAELVGLLAGLAAGIRVLWSLGKFLKEKWKGMFGIAALQVDITNLSEQVTFLVSEMHPNDGTSFRDVLNRIEHDVALANERQRARMLDTPEMIFETTADGDCVWVNRTYTRAVERALPELLGRGWVNGIASGDREVVVQGWYEAVQESREFEMNFSFQTPDGVSIPVMCRSYRMRNHAGEIIGYLGHCEKL